MYKREIIVMDKNKISYIEKLYESGCREEAYNYIHTNNINVLESENLSFLHLNYCISKGYYEEALNLKERFIKKYPKTKYIEDIKKLFPNENYEVKAKKYNKNKLGDCLDNICCCDCGCDAIDICIDCGPGDTGCIDLDLCCFCD